MMVEKRSLQDSTLSDERSPSPPTREEKWKRARQGKDGEYKSTATKVVADKIDSLVEEAEKGTFVPNGRDDILTNAIGTAEHGGNVRGEGRGVNISNYFGRKRLMKHRRSFLLTCGNRKKPTWLFPKTRVQPNGNDCGYYVMKNMTDIVSTSITKNWNEVFNDSTALTEDDLYELRNCWATCLLDLFNPKNDYDDGAEEGS
ncbi:hypothetical protein P8452_32083 [Trifolium repens]|nr:hypothetical protein P8452_32083 [Trifolium repens]